MSSTFYDSMDDILYKQVLYVMENKIDELCEIVQSQAWKDYRTAPNGIAHQRSVYKDKGLHRGVVTVPGTIDEIVLLLKPGRDLNQSRGIMEYLYPDIYSAGACIHDLSQDGQGYTTVNKEAFKVGQDNIEVCLVRTCRRINGAAYSVIEPIDIEDLPYHGIPSVGLCVSQAEKAGFVKIELICQNNLNASTFQTIWVNAALKMLGLIGPLLQQLRLKNIPLICRSQWVPDSWRSACSVCTRSFVIRRRHHCRRCGDIMCGKCAPPSRIGTSNKRSRFCIPCIASARYRYEDEIHRRKGTLFRDTVSTVASSSTHSNNSFCQLQSSEVHDLITLLDTVIESNRPDLLELEKLETIVQTEVLLWSQEPSDPNIAVGRAQIYVELVEKLQKLGFAESLKY